MPIAWNEHLGGLQIVGQILPHPSEVTSDPRLIDLLERGTLRTLWERYIAHLTEVGFEGMPGLPQWAAVALLLADQTDVPADVERLTLALASYCGLTPAEFTARFHLFGWLGDLFYGIHAGDGGESAHPFDNDLAEGL